MSSEAGFAEPWRVESVDECQFYHSMDLPGIGAVSGQWDLRGGVDDYLGGVALDGKRVLEIGPASGFLTFEMEQRGAEVVCVDTPIDHVWDFVPQESVDMDAIMPRFKEHVIQVRNSFWFCHGLFSSRAKMYYGDAYDLPESLGDFDVCLLGSILLHCQNPVKMIHSCARLTHGTMIVTEKRCPDLGQGPICRLVPNGKNETWNTWWDFTPEFFKQYLDVLGFNESSVHAHVQKFKKKEQTVEMFTVVASRPGVG